MEVIVTLVWLVYHDRKPLDNKAFVEFIYGKLVGDKGVEKALFKTLPERHHGLIPLNMEAIKAGKELALNQ